VSFSAGFSAVAECLPKRSKPMAAGHVSFFLSLPVSLTAKTENKNRLGGDCRGMQGRAKSLSLPEWTRTLLSPAIRRSPMSATVVKCGEPTPLINAVCFAWPATTLAARHDASRLMVERYRPGNRVSSEGAAANPDTPGQSGTCWEWQ
jgi:hypothetical protein